MFKFIVSAGCSQLIREIQLYSVSGEAMSNALTREMRAGDTMRHYDTGGHTAPYPDHDSDTGVGPVSACIRPWAREGQKCQVLFPSPDVKQCPVVTRCSAALPRHFRLCRTAAGAASTAQLGELQLLLLVVDRWIVSLTIAVVLLLLVL